MGTNLSQAMAEMTQIADMIHGEVQKVEQDLVEIIFDTLVGNPPEGTPVDTGWASANWVVSVNSPIGGSVPDKGNVSGAKGVSESSLTTFLSTDLSNISSIFITNRVSYIEALNNGTASQQSNMDFVDLAVQKGTVLISGKRIR